MEKLVKEVTGLVSEEYKRAASMYGGAANTPHEGYALIKEEEEEAEEQMSAVSQNIASLWKAVKEDYLPIQRHHLGEIKREAILGACELIQVAAMADKAIQGLARMISETNDTGCGLGKG